MWRVMRTILLGGIPGVLLAALAWTLWPPAPPPPGPTGGPGPSVPPPGAATETPKPGTANDGSAGKGSQPYAQIHQGDLEGTDDSGRQHWRLVAEDVTVDQSKQLVVLRNVHATMSTADGITLAITGDEGRY